MRTLVGEVFRRIGVGFESSTEKMQPITNVAGDHHDGFGYKIFYDNSTFIRKGQGNIEGLSNENHRIFSSRLNVCISMYL